MKSGGKILLSILGTIFVGLGILGVFLPLVPATPFLLLASACYVRSSDKLYNKLVSNKYVGPYITNFKDKKGMPLKAKHYTIALLWLSLIFSIITFNHLAIRLSLFGIGVAVTVFIYSIKTLDLSSQDSNS